MRKLIKNNILGFITGIIVMIGISVTAVNYIYSSNNVSYNDTSVKGALDDLYSKANHSSILSLPYYVFSGNGGYIGAYYSSSTTFSIGNGAQGLFGPFDLTDVHNINVSVRSFHSSYSGTIHISVSDTIPQSLASMQSSVIYQSFAAAGSSAKSIVVPTGLDTSKKYWIFFYTNSCYGGGYCGMAADNFYFN